MNLLLLLLSIAIHAEPSKDPRLAYTIRFDSTDLTGVSVELKVRNAPPSMQLAANAHPEYDDKYWRYVDDLRAQSATGQSLTVVRVDSVRWQISDASGDVTVRYRVNFPQETMPRASWKPFLAATGGLIGGPHSFLYPIGLEKEQVAVTIDIPPTWKVGTGFDGTSTQRRFIARDVHTLMESPMLVGQLSEWTFNVHNIAHRIFYWRPPNASAFDSVAFVSGIEKIATQAIDLFGSAPYREYSFLFQDGAWGGGLEHPNSVTLGAQSEELAKDPNFALEDAAHEFFHTWNLMAIKPAEYRDVDYRVQGPVAELWFSEGLTIFYSDLLRRRAGLPTNDSTRMERLKGLIERYLSLPGLARYSAEQISRVEYNSTPEATGDFILSAHLEGELLGTILDLRIRDATNGVKSMDDVMKLMYQRFRNTKFTSRDVQRAVDEVCSCSSAPIFNQYVFNPGTIDFNRYLEPIGLRSSASWKPATNEDGTPQADVRVWAYQSGRSLKLRVGDPTSIWAKAGLHTGDDIVSINGVETKTWPEARRIFGALKIGDSTTFRIKRGNQTIERTVKVTGYDRPYVTIAMIDRTSDRQKRLRDQWLRGSSTASARVPAPPAARLSP